MSTRFAVETRELCKSFGDVKANDAIDLAVEAGTVHGIVGENGAGKSTLLKMLFGFYQPDRGDLLVGGNHQRFRSPTDAMAAGIGMVHQHFMLVEPFTVLENIILGAEQASNLEAAKKIAREELEALEKTFGFDLPLDTPVADLAVGVRQRAEILKALYRGAETLILDEPTAVLTPQETKQLFALIEQLKSEGKTVVFVTHKLHEIMAITDNVTVIRGGQKIADVRTGDTTAESLAELMVGAKIKRATGRVERDEGDICLSLTGVTVEGAFRNLLQDINLTVRNGEVLGIAGVAGNGQTELLDVVTGLRGVSAGEVVFKNETIAADGIQTNPIELRRKGMAHVAEDRLRTAVVEDMSATENAVLGYQREAENSKHGLMRLKEIARTAKGFFETQDIRPRKPELAVGSFSGGNQQKLVIARELSRDPDLLVIGQPTRGVDIGAVTKIHDQITALRNSGKAVLLVSADLDELLALSDRIAVMNEGEIVGTLRTEEADETQLGLLMAGKREHSA